MEKTFKYIFLCLTLMTLVVLSSACASQKYRRPPYAKGYFMEERGYIQPYPAPIAPLPPSGYGYEENNYFIPVSERGVPMYRTPCNYPGYPIY